MISYSWVDVIAVGFFILEWAVYALTLEHTGLWPRQPVGAHERLPRSVDAPAARRATRAWSIRRS